MRQAVDIPDRDAGRSGVTYIPSKLNEPSFEFHANYVFLFLRRGAANARISGERANLNGDRWARLQENVGTLQPHPNGSEADGARWFGANT
jgi:hypothetical protein